MTCSRALLLLILTTTFPASLLYGQGLTYVGFYETGDFSGHARFSYDLIAGDTVLNGSFQIGKSNLTQMMRAKYPAFFHSGSMSDGQPDGQWTFNFSTYYIDTTQHIFIKDQTYPLPVSGSNLRISGTLTNGEIGGGWMATEEIVENGDQTGVLLASKMNFEKGKPVGSFQIADKYSVLAGRFLADGSPHDVWELYSKQSPETAVSWHFSLGKLLKIVQVQDGRSITYPIYDPVDSVVTEVPFDEDFFRIIKLKYDFLQDSLPPLSDRVSSVLLYSLNSYDQASAVLQRMRSEASFHRFPVVMPHFPLDKKEIAHMDSIVSMYQNITNHIKYLSENTQLNILKLSDENLAVQSAVVQQLDHIYVSKLETMISYYQDGLLSYIRLERLIPQLWTREEMLPDLPVTYEWGDTTKERTYPLSRKSDLSHGKQGVDGLYELTHVLDSNLTDIRRKLDKKLERVQFEERLKILEDSLLVGLSELDTLADSLQTEADPRVVQSLDQIKKSAKDELTHYSSISSLTEKSARAQVLIGCQDSLKALAVQVSDIPTKRMELRALYTDDVWNPFTATVMTEQVKRRITDAYEGTLLPYIYTLLDENLACDSVGDISRLITAIHERMTQLRQEDTRKLERKLKKKTEVAEILDLMQISWSLEKIGMP